MADALAFRNVTAGYGETVVLDGVSLTLAAGGTLALLGPGKFAFGANGRAVAMTHTDGFAKVVADRASKLILGFTTAGPEASDLIAEGALALEMGAYLEDVALTIHAHPTLAEAVHEACKAALGEAIHALKLPEAERVRMVNQVPVANAVTYLVGTTTLVWYLASLAPRLLGFDLRKEARDLEARFQKACNPFFKQLEQHRRPSGPPRR